MNKTNKIATLGIVALFAVVLTVSAASAVPTFHFVPQDISVPEGYCHSIDVGIYLNLSAGDNVRMGQFGFSYDPLCGDITDRTLNAGYPPDYPINQDWSSWNTSTYPECWNDTRDWIVFDFWYPHDGPEDILIGTITLHCNSTEYCTNEMNFGDLYPPCPMGPIILWDADYEEVSYSTISGTFTCGTPAETYTISGNATTTGEPGGAPAKTVNIENLNNSKEWEADVNATTGFYNLTLNVVEDVNATEILRIIACDTPANNASTCNRTDHKVMNAPGEETVNLILNNYCQNYLTFPYRTWNESNWSGPASMEMLIDHYLDVVPNQTVLNKTAIEDNNLACNKDILFADPRGMRYTLNDYLYYPNPYVAHYGIGYYTDINKTLHYMCKWHYLGPGAAPAYGDYSNWMVIRGIHTNKTPSFTQGSYEIKGFWINDPKDLGGIGENSYKSVEQWKSEYHKMLIVDDEDQYNGTYVAVCEPPEDDDVEVTLAKPKPRLAEAITPMLAEEPMMLYGVKQLALEKVVKDDELLKIVQAAIDGVNEELVPYDPGFASVFAKTVPGQPMLVSSDNGDYYVVPFNVPVKERLPVKIMPVEIERPKISGLKKLERMKRVAKKIEFKPIPIEPIRVEKTLVVVIVDATDGSFKEASWVENPAKYLPVSKIEAMKLAVGEVLDELHVVAKKDARDLEVIQTRPTIELVYVDASPYYPDWKVTVNGKVFYVSQDGTVSN